MVALGLRERTIFCDFALSSVIPEIHIYPFVSVTVVLDDLNVLFKIAETPKSPR